MNRNFLFNIYKDGITTGSLVLKAPGQYYKINDLLGVLPLTADTNQFIRSVIAGATPHAPFDLEDIKGKEYKFELQFASFTTYVKLGLKTAHDGKAMLFNWQGKFSDFREGFKVF